MNTSSYTIQLNTHLITYTLTRKAVKNINLRIRSDSSIHVSAAPRVTIAQIEKFLQKNATFILHAIDEMKKRRETMPFLTLQDGDTIYLAGKAYTLDVRLGLHNTIHRSGNTVYMEVIENTPVIRQQLYHKLLQQEGKRLFPDSATRMFSKLSDYPIEMPSLRQRIMRSRWGSCMPYKGIITMNTYLAIMPERIIDHVMLHELCHLIHPNHSQHFYNVMTMVMPDWKERKALIAQYLPYCV